MNLPSMTWIALNQLTDKRGVSFTTATESGAEQFTSLQINIDFDGAVGAVGAAEYGVNSQCSTPGP
jgi:hypothetical protein